MTCIIIYYGLLLFTTHCLCHKHLLVIDFILGIIFVIYLLILIRMNFCLMKYFIPQKNLVCNITVSTKIFPFRENFIALLPKFISITS